MKIILRWAISAVAILVSAYLLPGIYVEGVVAALVLALVLGAINLFVRPILIILTLPLTILTLGLFVIVLNTVLIMVAGAIVPGVTISSFFSALLFGLVLAVIHSVFKSFED